jgi:carbamoyltransferase
MIILGLHAFTHDSAAALVVDGRLVAFAQEERFSRRKNDGRFPRLAIDSCLAEANVTPSEVDRVALGFRPWVGALNRLAYQLRRPASGARAAWNLLAKGRNNLGLARLLRDVGIQAPITRMDHHACHAWASLAACDAEDAAVLVVDGVAEAWSGASFAARRRPPGMECLQRIRFPASLGLVYAAVTEHLGFRHNCEEGKVMAMAALGTEDLVGDFASVCGIRGRTIRVDQRCFDFGGRWTTHEFNARFGPPRSPGAPLEVHHFALARALQTAVENAVASMARSLVQQTGARALCLSGGLALNPAVNSAVGRALEGHAQLELFPAGGDAGTAFGAAVAAEFDGRWRCDHAFWGGGVSEAAVDDALRSAGLDAGSPDPEVASRAAELLAEGALVGWCRGRSEMGPRALGHRSILADPRQEAVRDRLNRQVKRREDFQPYGATALWPLASRLLPGAGPSPSMLRTWPVTAATRERIPAVVHADGTTRLQTVTEGDPSGLGDLLRSFAAMTDTPLVLNTSLNRRGEPLAETPHDAVAIFKEAGLDFLVLENRLVRRGR